VYAPLVIWDKPEDPPETMGELFYWARYSHSPSRRSIPSHLEQHAESLRGKYLAFVHDVAESRIGGRRVIDHLTQEDGFSLWWMTQLAEKSPFKSPKIYDCLKLLALEDILKQRKTFELILHSSNRCLADTVRLLCRHQQISFSWRRSKNLSGRWTPLRIFRALPHSIQGIVSLARHILKHLPLRKTGTPNWYGGADSIFFCSYFFNLDPIQCAAGRFHSRQWGDLPCRLQQYGRRSNWIHHFLTSPGMPHARTCVKWVQSFNKDPEAQGYHAFLDCHLSFAVIFRAFKRWLKLNVVSWRLRQINSAFYPKDSSVCLWRFLRDDWQTSITGQVAINNCLWLELFDVLLKEMPRQRLGFYLWENQGWEFAMLRAWHKYGHGDVVGVPHTTVCFWHLNNFVDSRVFALDRVPARPSPTFLAVNGPMARDAFLETGYPRGQLMEVEALRFQYLAKLRPRSETANDSSRPPEEGDNTERTMKLLILGDISFEQTIELLRCTDKASPLFSVSFSFSLKPHPVCRVTQSDYPTLSFTLVDGPIGEILGNYDFAFASNSTSAGLDAYLAGLPVVIFLDETTLNNSPLRGLEGVRFVSTGNELAAALQQLSGSGHSIASVERVFWVDANLPRWRKMLSMSTASC
jgi:surface carbohydrate biosynthesis protein (TIGR04326 family)